MSVLSKPLFKVEVRIRCSFVLQPSRLFCVEVTADSVHFVAPAFLLLNAQYSDC